MRRPGVRAAPQQHNGSTPSDSAPQGAVLGEDVIGSLFGTPQVGDDDEYAARSLALAFSASPAYEGAESLDASGEPARRASKELSLDAVFGADEAPAPAAPSSFSFDQFFSQRASTDQGPASAGGESAKTASREDVAQFSQWLDGLKQR